MKQRYTEEQIIHILQEAEATTDRASLLRKYEISEWTFYRWRKRFGGRQLPEAKRLKQLEDENARLKRVLADQMLANQARDWRKCAGSDQALAAPTTEANPDYPAQ